MEVGEMRAGRRDPFCLVICAAAAVAVALGFLAAAGGVPAPEASGEPLVQVVRSAKQFPNRVTEGRVSLGYPDGLWVIAEMEPRTSNMLGREVTGSQKVVGDDNFSHGFYVGEFTGTGFDDLRGYTEKAQEEARRTADALEERLRDPETPDAEAAMWSSFLESLRKRVYLEPQLVVLDGRRGLIWDIVVPYENDGFVTRVYFAEVGGDTVGFVYCGFYQHEYDADPAFWDDILASLEVR